MVTFRVPEDSFESTIDEKMPLKANGTQPEDTERLRNVDTRNEEGNIVDNRTIKLNGIREALPEVDLKVADPVSQHDKDLPMTTPKDHSADIEADEADHDDLQPEDATKEPCTVGTVAPKKKKKRKPKSQRGLTRPTGFEEYYVEVPLTPEQYEEEKGLYDPSRSFRERIQTALQNYYKKRNLDSERKNVLDKYLTFGGIQGGQKMFSGGIDTKTQDAAEIATLSAPHVVDIDDDDDNYVVDFEACLKGFLSSRLPIFFDMTAPGTIDKCVGVPKNFLNYLLYHNVCPEYHEQIENARKLCDKAREELAAIVQVQPLLPGDFNTACSEVFGGQYHGLHNPASEVWMSEKDKEQWTIGLPAEKARKIFKIGFAAYATDSQIALYNTQAKKKAIQTIREMEVDLEIIGITPGHSIPETSTLYQHELGSDHFVLGKMSARAWRNPVIGEEDLIEGDKSSRPEVGTVFEFWMEDHIMEKFLIGMKLEATVRELSFGIHHFDNIHAVKCSFANFLANEMMLEWKKIEDEWLPPRPKNESGAQEEDEVDESIKDDE